MTESRLVDSDRVPGSSDRVPDFWTLRILTASLAAGGSETQIRLLARTLARRGIDVEVLAREGASAAGESFRLVTIPTPFLDAGGWTGVPSVVSVFDNLLFARRVSADLARRGRPGEIVLLNGAGQVAWHLAPRLARRGFRVVVRVSGPGGFEAGSLRERFGRRGAALAHRRLRAVDRFWVNAERVRDGLVEEGVAVERIWTIPNGIDLARFRSAPCEDAPRMALAAGRLVGTKGMASLVEAWSSCDGDLSICGEGPDRVRLERLARTRGIGDRIRFLGHREDLDGLLRESDLFVHPSPREGMSNAVLEGMAAGVPVVAVEGAVPDDWPVARARSAEPSALADAVRRVRADPSTSERAAAARRYVEAHHNIDRIADLVVDRFGEIVGA